MNLRSTTAIRLEVRLPISVEPVPYASHIIPPVWPLAIEDYRVLKFDESASNEGQLRVPSAWVFGFSCPVYAFSQSIDTTMSMCYSYT